MDSIRKAMRKRLMKEETVPYFDELAGFGSFGINLTL